MKFFLTIGLLQNRNIPLESSGRVYLSGAGCLFYIQEIKKTCKRLQVFILISSVVVTASPDFLRPASSFFMILSSGFPKSVIV